MCSNQLGKYFYHSNIKISICSPKVNKHTNIGVVWCRSWTQFTKINCKYLKGEDQTNHLSGRQHEYFVLHPEPKLTVEVFVVNLVREIQIYTEPSQWRYATTKFNPADKTIRVMTVKDIANSNSWWSGPEIFGTTEEEWPYK